MAETPDDLLSPDQIAAIARLEKFYSKGTDAIKAVYFDIDPATLNKAEVKKAIDKITQDLENGTNQWISESFPEMYVAAAIVAKKLVEKEKKADGKKAVSKVAFQASAIDKVTIDAIAQSTATLYAEALSGVRRKASNILDQVTEQRVKYELSQATLNPITLKDMRATVAGIVQEAGIQSITDKAGKTWQLDTYADMVARTQHANIVNSAVKVQALQEGFDLVRISVHGAEDSCGDFEGKIYSLTGATKGYPVLDEVIVGTHLFGINCKHTYTPVSDRRAAELGAAAVGDDTRYVDLKKFAGIKQKNTGGLVRQQRDLIKLFPTLSKDQQASVLALARQSKSPALASLEELYAK